MIDFPSSAKKKKKLPTNPIISCKYVIYKFTKPQPHKILVHEIIYSINELWFRNFIIENNLNKHILNDVKNKNPVKSTYN